MFDINMDKVYVKTFGGFDLYYRGELIYFSSSKAKEFIILLQQNRIPGIGAVTINKLVKVAGEHGYL